MMSVHEFQDRVQGPDQSTTSISDGGDDNAAAARPSWTQRHFFAVFLAGSLIFHVGFITIVSFFDLRWVASWMNYRELPVELINEEQIQKEEKKAGSADAKGQPQEQSNSPAKAAQSDPPVKPPEAQTEKPSQPHEEQNKPAEKPSENKQSEPKQLENKTAESKPDETKSTETKPTATKPAENKPEEKMTERNASYRQPQTGVNKQQEAQQKELQQQELAKKSAQKPAVPATPKPAETQQPAAPINSPQAQEQRPFQQQPEQAAPAPPPAPSRMPTFLYQPSDRLSLAIPAPLPTNDADAEPVSYKVIVFGMLERAKNYPEGARERHAMGHVVVAFSIDDTGQPQNISMLESSGEGDLDTEAVAMISRAAPFPVPPIGAQRDFAVNIGFGGR